MGALAEARNVRTGRLEPNCGSWVIGFRPPVTDGIHDGSGIGRWPEKALGS